MKGIIKKIVGRIVVFGAYVLAVMFIVATVALGIWFDSFKVSLGMKRAMRDGNAVAAPATATATAPAPATATATAPATAPAPATATANDNH